MIGSYTGSISSHVMEENGADSCPGFAFLLVLKISFREFQRFLRGVGEASIRSSGVASQEK